MSLNEKGARAAPSRAYGYQGSPRALSAETHEIQAFAPKVLGGSAYKRLWTSKSQEKAGQKSCNDGEAESFRVGSLPDLHENQRHACRIEIGLLGSAQQA
jgi:hypothetical protein